MARSRAKKKALEDSEVRAAAEENSTLAIQYYINGTSSDTPPNLKLNLDTMPHQPQGSTYKTDTKPCDKIDTETRKKIVMGAHTYTQEQMTAAQALLMLSQQATVFGSS